MTLAMTEKPTQSESEKVHGWLPRGQKTRDACFSRQPATSVMFLARSEGVQFKKKKLKSALYLYIYMLFVMW